MNIKDILPKQSIGNNVIRIKFLYFWPNFNYNNNFLTKLLERNNINYIISNNISDLDFIIFSSFFYIYENFYKSNFTEDKYDILNFNKCIKKILYLSEPIEYFYKDCYHLFNINYFDYIFGSINNNLTNNYYKFPYYLLYYNYIGNLDYSTLYYDNNDYSFYNNINKYIKNIDIKNKEYFCLINSHDQGNLRKIIYYKIKQKYDIACPGKLFNNLSNKELNNIGKYEYLKKFIFNICFENYKTNIKGYITEKLLESCKSGCIPIFYGHFDEIDEKVFNKNRIIFIENINDISINNYFNIIDELINNPLKLEEFYRQDIFLETAHETINELEKNLINIFIN